MLTTILIIIFILILISCYYYYTIPSPPIIKKEEKTIKNEEGDYTIAFLSNYGTEMIETRAVNVIIFNSKYYLYSNKKAYHVEQLNKDNRCTLMIYTKKGNSKKQVVLYGELDIINTTTNLVLYELIIKHRKVSVTIDSKVERITNYSFDSTNPKELKTDFIEMNELVSFLN